MKERQCRFCREKLTESFVDLGMSPLSNAYLQPEQLFKKEFFYPLHAFVCEECLLVQVEEFEPPDRIFKNYAYFSSYSDTWLQHARKYAAEARLKLGLGQDSLVVEVGSNDGYLLQYFREADIPVLGVEPASNIAKAAELKGIPTTEAFFGIQTAKTLAAQGKQADLLIGNNVLAHVPDLHDFVAGMKILLKKDGVISVEFPHLLCLMRDNQFDTIYHEHFSYFSFTTARRVFEFHGFTVFDVEEIPTHGGSLRLYCRHAEDLTRPVHTRTEEILEKEEQFGLNQFITYRAFNEQVKETKRNLLAFLVQAKDQRKSIAGYGAPAKGNTLLNYCGIRTDFLDYTVDRNPHKQGLYLPGTHIPIYAPQKIQENRPDYLLILPWNLKEEVMEQMAWIREWGGQFVTAIPKVAVY